MAAVSRPDGPPRLSERQPADQPEPLEPKAALTLRLLLEAASADEPDVKRLRDQAVMLNIAEARGLALRYRGRGVPDEDLVQTAYLGLVKAVQAFNPDRADNFMSFAVPTILGEVKRYFRDHAWDIKPPRRIQELQPQIWEAAARLARAAGETPSTAELAADLGVTIAEIDESLAANSCYALASLDWPEPTPYRAGLTLVDRLGDFDPGFDRADAILALTPSCRRLSQRDRRILYLRFFHEWTQAQIADELGVTQMQVSRLLNRMLRQLRSLVGETNDERGPAWADQEAASA